MVMVLAPGGSFTFAAAAAVIAAAPGGTVAWPSWPACGCPALLAALAWFVPAGCLVATTATGSPPRGSLTSSAQLTTTMPNGPSRPASACGAPIGSLGGLLFFLLRPRGAFRSSVTTARYPCESSGKSRTRMLTSRRTGERGRPRDKRGGPKAAPPKIGESADHRLVGYRDLGIRREGRIDLGPVQQIKRHIKRLVVLGIRRHVRLRAGLLGALGRLQVAA